MKLWFPLHMYSYMSMYWRTMYSVICYHGSRSRVSHQPWGRKEEPWCWHLTWVAPEWPDWTLQRQSDRGAWGEGTQATTASAALGFKRRSQITPAGFLR